MPGFNGTGPQGMGSGTGKGMGNCGGGSGQGLGGGFRRFGGRCCNRNVRTGLQLGSKEDKIKMLKNEEKMLEEDLKAVKEEKKELEK